jgi:hypothetical protein
MLVGEKKRNTVEDENEHEHDLGESGVPVVNDTRSSGLEMLKGRKPGTKCLDGA